MEQDELFLLNVMYLALIVCHHISVKLSPQGPSDHLKVPNIIPNRVTGS